MLFRSEISFKTKPEIALEQLRWACEAGVARGVVLMDAGYGALFSELAVPNSYRPRGSPATARASHPELDRNHASTADRRSRKKPAAMSLLQCSNRRTVVAQKFMTQ